MIGQLGGVPRPRFFPLRGGCYAFEAVFTQIPDRVGNPSTTISPLRVKLQKAVLLAMKKFGKPGLRSPRQ
jgi:hypothetical protein